MAKKEEDHVSAAIKYAKNIVNEKIPSCKWTRLACERQLKDLKEATKRGFFFDKDAANRVCTFMERLPHIKGKWAGQLIKLEPWQKFGLTTIFGWKRKDDGYRRFRTAYEEVPRKNAKSTKSSGIGLYMSFADKTDIAEREGGAEVYSAATTRDQARIVFQDARLMAQRTKGFRNRFGVIVGAHNIYSLESASKFEALSAESSSLDGLNVHCGIIDELHAHKTRAVFDVIETATGARAQPLLWLITTAGSNRAGICYEQRTYLTKILSGIHEDDTYFGIIYTIDDGDDWTDPVNWAKANPNYGISVYEDDIARLCRKAQQMPSAQNNFLTKRLNVWVNADTAWMEMRAWDKCGDSALQEEDFYNEECIVAIDLSSKVDIAAKMKVFRRQINDEYHYYAFGTYYLPEDTVIESGNSQYQGWVTEGRLTTTSGNVIDFGCIEDDLKQDASNFQIREVPYDPFQATQFSQRMIGDGMPMIEMRPTTLNFSEPMKELEALVLAGRFHHNSDPILTWMISNIVCHLDAKDNIYPRKERPENKIDGVIALIMAIGRWITTPAPEESIYEHGPL